MNERKIDIGLIIPIILLMMVGTLMVFSASAMRSAANHKSVAAMFLKQLVWAGISLSIMIAVAKKYDYKNLLKGRIAVTALIVSIILLIGLEIIARPINGATRWYVLGPIHFQPSEMAKLAMIVYYAHFLSVKSDVITNFQEGFIPLLAFSAVPVVLILLQPNLSTALMILIICGTMLFTSKARLHHLFIIVLAVVPLVIAVMIINPYQVSRVTGWMGNITKVLPADYQIRQSLIGFGRGGLFGQGLGQSRQKFMFLPDSHTDFIFSITGEEFGFIGVSLILILFMIILIRGLRVVHRIPDAFGKFLALGLTLNIVLYALVNAGVVTMLLPTTGLPMPFISYGGTNMVFLGLATGLLLNISSQTGSTAPAANWTAPGRQEAPGIKW